MSTTTENGASLSGWQNRAAHRITLPSGMEVKVRLPGIATLLEHGQLPDDLFDIAYAELIDTVSVDGIDGPNMIPGSIQWVSKADGKDDKLARIKTYGEFQRHLVAAALIEPKMSYDEITAAVLESSLPEDDLSMISEIVQRIRYKDARGVRIGVEPLERWATFREEHAGITCTGDPDCPGCQNVINRFSTVGVGQV